MEHTHLTQLVTDRRRAREATATDHRLTKDIAEPVPGTPRLRYERKHRPVPGRQTLAGNAGAR